jgi:hypothetical protein
VADLVDRDQGRHRVADRLGRGEQGGAVAWASTGEARVLGDQGRERALSDARHGLLEDPRSGGQPGEAGRVRDRAVLDKPHHRLDLAQAIMGAIRVLAVGAGIVLTSVASRVA